MNTISNHVKNNFAGMLVFGDVHADYELFMKAYHYAEHNNYFFMSLGDLVDRGSFPYEVVSKMHEIVKAGKGGFTIGNHDDKFKRFAGGAKVSFSYDGRNTLANVGPERQVEFLRMYTEMIDTPVLSGMFHTFDDIILIHAASHPDMWTANANFSSAAKSRALYGEITGKKLSDGYPERIYTWIEEVPIGKTIIVGHDRMPIYDIPIVEPLIRTSNHGGKVIFTDTGCGKGGYLTGTVVVHDKRFKVEKFMEFK